MTCLPSCERSLHLLRNSKDMKQSVDYSLYLVTDTGLCPDGNIIDVAMNAVEGGATIVQIREKNMPSRDFFQLALAMKKNLGRTGVPLIINDRVDIAIASGADGVHVGQTDLPGSVVREMVGPDKIVGISINTLTQIDEAISHGADYLSLSPVFPTPTKPDTTKPFGIEGLVKARGMTAMPMITIGGINLANTGEIIATGMDGVAVVSAICSARSPRAAARELAGIIRKSRQAG